MDQGESNSTISCEPNFDCVVKLFMGAKNLRSESYRVRAVELRAVAEVMSPENKKRVLRIADDYESMADQIERLDLESGPLKPKPTP